MPFEYCNKERKYVRNRIAGYRGDIQKRSPNGAYRGKYEAGAKIQKTSSYTESASQGDDKRRRRGEEVRVELISRSYTAESTKVSLFSSRDKTR